MIDIRLFQFSVIEIGNWIDAEQSTGRIIHQIRNTNRYVASKNQKEFMKALKPVYKASTEEAGLLALDKLEEKWGKKYPYPITQNILQSHVFFTLH